ncbi:hypothetical protein I0C86_17515 [Plantactinospora sp. S1510]|jgi:hypothetical protein|uniref:Uncharacterized protein n=1 Tax=Plantactinospora alkalitolerans TaxID=2789879 RepID=A0ABS0GX12_9ACTN|nr:hypothetical protein [Plantactinospora alkalitolerans]MBF9130743.1 hypothetical protein [Plantactinospora alkalitolerans]
MTRPNDEEPMLDVARGDPALSQHLRNSLKLLRERSDDPEFRRLADDIIAGRRGLRDAATSPVFNRALNPQVERFAQRWEELSDEEKAELAARGEADFAASRERIERERRERERWRRDHPDE